MNEYADILAEAKRLAESLNTWDDLAAALFSSHDGLVQRYWPDRAERRTFQRTNTYNEIRGLLKQKIREAGVVARAELGRPK